MDNDTRHSMRCSIHSLEQNILSVKTLLATLETTKEQLQQTLGDMEK